MGGLLQEGGRDMLVFHAGKTFVQPMPAKMHWSSGARMSCSKRWNC